MTKSVKLNYKVVYNQSKQVENFESLLSAAKELSTKKNFAGNIDFISQYYTAKKETNIENPMIIAERLESLTKVMFIKGKSTINILFSNYIKQVKDSSIIDLTVRATMTGKNLKTLKRLVTILIDTNSFFEISKEDLSAWLDKNFKPVIEKSATITVDNNAKIPSFIDANSLISAELITECANGTVDKHITSDIEVITDFLTSDSAKTQEKSV